MIILNLENMKYIFRGHIIFEYKVETQDVIQHSFGGLSGSFDYCRFIPEDYKLLSQFFDTVYRHIEGEDVELVDIKVN